MAEKFVFKEERDETIRWAFIALITERAQREKPNSDINQVWPNKDPEMSVEVTIDGVEVSFRHLVKRLCQCQEEYILGKAKELIQEKESEISEIIWEAFQEIESKLRNFVPREE